MFLFVSLPVSLSLFWPCVCVAIFSQLAKGDIFAAPDLAPAALGGEKQSQSGRDVHTYTEREEKKGQQRVRPSSKKQQQLLFQTALCVCLGEDGLGPSLSLFYFFQLFSLLTNFHSLLFLSLSLFIRPPFFLSFVFFCFSLSLCVCNFRCQ